MIEILQQMCGIPLNDAGPTTLGYLLVIIGTVVVALVFLGTVVFFIRPGERDSNHIKRRILRDDF